MSQICCEIEATLAIGEILGLMREGNPPPTTAKATETIDRAYEFNIPKSRVKERSGFVSTIVSGNKSLM
jgi:hypothetical protein